jgi:phosphohistidine phosphatase SixA
VALPTPHSPRPTHLTDTSLHVLPSRRSLATKLTGWRSTRPDELSYSYVPFTRAQQTAEIVASAYEGLRLHTTSSLEPDSAFADFVAWLRTQRGEMVAVVGHEPHLGTLVTWLMTGIEDSRVPLKKGAAVLLEFPAVPSSGTGRLQWALTASQLGRLADR